MKRYTLDGCIRQGTRASSPLRSGTNARGSERQIRHHNGSLSHNKKPMDDAYEVNDKGQLPMAAGGPLFPFLHFLSASFLFLKRFLGNNSSPRYNFRGF